MKIDITDDIKWILNKLNQYGKGYVVGGYIRDKLLGLTPSDCDFCTDIDYNVLKEIFKNCSPRETGKFFGVIRIDYKGKKYDIAKLREDIEFTQEKIPTKIRFIDDIKLDLQRRDFTVNAIAFDGEKIITILTSCKDISNRKLRFVGDATKRIKADPIRILRGIRIAGSKKLTILDETRQSMLKHINEIKQVPIERVQTELFKMFTCKRTDEIFCLLYDLGVLEVFFPKTYKSIAKNMIKKKFARLDRIAPKCLTTRLIVIFLKTPEELNILKLSKKLEQKVRIIINNYHNIKKLNSRYNIKKLLSEIGIDGFKKLLIIAKLEMNVDKIEKIFKDILLKKEVISLKQLAISGNDIMELNIEKIEIKRCFDDAFDHILKNPDLNNKQSILKFIKGRLYDE